MSLITLPTNLKGKTIMITGASSGIGMATAKQLAAMGAALVLVCRDRERSEAVVDEIISQTNNHNIELFITDLRSQKQIRKFANTFMATDRPLHVLLNNAGLVIRERIITVDGFETMFAVNHLSHYLLTRLLMPRITASAPARIVNVASEAHRFAGGRMNFDDLNAEKKFGGNRNYSQSKLANLLFTHELARRLKGTTVTVNAVNPGPVASGFAQGIGGFPQIMMTLMRPMMRSPQKGAQTSVYLCASKDVEQTTGLYFSNCREKRTNDAALNDGDARRLWAVSAKMTSLGSDMQL